MKAKKILALMLALVMALALAAPAMAKKDKGSKDKPAGPAVAAVDVDKIEEEPRLSLIENGAKIDTGKYSAIYIKQANDIAIIVQRDDLPGQGRQGRYYGDSRRRHGLAPQEQDHPC